MKKEDKELLLKDLCARLPHKQKVCYKIHTSSEEITATLSGALLDYFKTEEIKVVRPYLRPISSMTKEEMEELRELCGGIVWTKDILHDEVLNIYYRHDALDWLLKHHFDTRGLIEMGLALEAPEGMYKID